MDKIDFSEFCSHGGCTSKLDPAVLSQVLAHIPKKKDDNLIVGYDDSDDGAVYKLSDDIAIVQTLDFFKPMVEDPYLFGKIAAANALSDIYAMGGEPKVALNIVCFSEKMSPFVLMEMLRGGAEKVHEAGAVLSGGHSVNDEEPKYGLSVTGVVNPKKVIKNNSCKIGDKIILTKPLGVGIALAANNMGDCPADTFDIACKQMETLNKYAAEIAFQYNINGITDVTGFGFLGHLNEMVQEDFSIEVDADNIPIIDGTLDLAKEFYITAAGQKNRNHLKGKVKMELKNFPLEEIMFDPQTSGGLLISIDKHESATLIENLEKNNICAKIVGKVVERQDYNIIVKGDLL